MRLRLVRKWKVKSAAWAGVAAAMVAGPLAFVLIVSPEPPGSPATSVVATGPGREASERAPAPARADERLASPTEQRLAALLRTVRSDKTDLRVKTDAVARMGRLEHPSAVEALAKLATEGRQGADPNFVGLAAMNALWARGERQLVHELAAASSDPAVKSKAVALARARTK